MAGHAMVSMAPAAAHSNHALATPKCCRMACPDPTNRELGATAAVRQAVEPRLCAQHHAVVQGSAAVGIMARVQNRSRGMYHGSLQHQ